jgi:type II secretion system protein H
MSAQRRSHEATKRRRGCATNGAFTLVELLVVVVLVGIAASVVTLQLHGSTDRARLRAATIQLEQALRLARHRAMTRHETVWLVFEVGGGRYRLVFARQEQDTTGVWHTLDSVSIKRAAVRGEAAPSTRQDEFAIRVTPTGASLPWALELWTRSARRVVWTDGISGRLGFVDEIGLHELRWGEETEHGP